MGSRGSFLESGSLSVPAKWHTIDYVDGVKVLAPKKPKASICLPEKTNIPGTAYVTYRKDGTFNQYITFDSNGLPEYRIDYGTHNGEKTLHVHYFQCDNVVLPPIIIKPWHPLYEKHKHLLKELNIVKGVKLNELYEYISHYHDAEFEYNGTPYVLQVEVDENGKYLVIWDCTPNYTKCVAKHEITLAGDISKEDINAILTIACFDGKSFLDIEKNITITVIY